MTSLRVKETGKEVSLSGGFRTKKGAQRSFSFETKKELRPLFFAHEAIKPGEMPERRMS